MPDPRSGRRRRRWDHHDEDDPLAGLVNLFDLWMVFSIALLIVFVGSSKQHKQPAIAANAPQTAGAEKQASLDRAKAIDHYRLSRDELNGQGEKLGTAYRLPSGEIVCVPDGADRPASSP
ncbi:MAG: hypothetical protein ABS79_05320 [Planctomycetes bacterium SCN 63-9]|nr:MAG: hypothetical protein ABS79_05320 [Planctomycetes bacterium SCN 63-9]